MGMRLWKDHYEVLSQLAVYKAGPLTCDHAGTMAPQLSTALSLSVPSPYPSQCQAPSLVSASRGTFLIKSTSEWIMGLVYDCFVVGEHPGNFEPQMLRCVTMTTDVSLS